MCYSHGYTPKKNEFKEIKYNFFIKYCNLENNQIADELNKEALKK